MVEVPPDAVVLGRPPDPRLLRRECAPCDAPCVRIHGEARRLILAATAASLLVMVATACGAEATPTDAGIDVREPLPPPPVWPRDMPALDGLGERRGRTLARSIVHLHSPLSHDACDGEGWVDGALADAECLAHLREAACTLRMDALMLTDHSPHVGEVTFEGAHWIQGDDEAVRDADGNVIAARWVCPDGRRVLVTVGSENELMPIGLLRHPSDPSDPVALAVLYESDGPEAADAFRAAGGLALYAHTEGHSIEQLRATHPDGIEIYNTHANVDPDIRELHLGLGSFDYLGRLLAFSSTGSRLAPDLSFLSFFSPNDNALGKWDTLLAEGWRLTGLGGCDAHENTFEAEMPDGERGDSYRRMMRWHTNHLLVDDVGRDAVMDALRVGRLYLTFEVLGTPVGFDFVAERGAENAEMGETIASGATLRVVRPSLPDGFPASPAPTIRMRILRAASGGAIEVAAGGDATLEFTPTEPGAYRAEVWMIPEHARPFLDRLADDLIRDVPWVYSNPIYVE